MTKTVFLWPFSEKQKEVVRVLIFGGSVSKIGQNKYSVRDDKTNPVMRIHSKTWYHVEKVCRRDAKRNAFVLDKKLVRSLSGNYWVYREYIQAKKKLS